MAKKKPKVPDTLLKQLSNKTAMSPDFGMKESEGLTPEEVKNNPEYDSILGYINPDKDYSIENVKKMSDIGFPITDRQIQKYVGDRYYTSVREAEELEQYQNPGAPYKHSRRLQYADAAKAEAERLIKQKDKADPLTDEDVKNMIEGAKPLAEKAFGEEAKWAPKDPETGKPYPSTVLTEADKRNKQKVESPTVFPGGSSGYFKTTTPYKEREAIEKGAGKRRGKHIMKPEDVAKKLWS